MFHQHASKILMFLVSEVLWNLRSPVGLEGLNPSLERLFPFQMICWLKRLIRMAFEQVGLNMESVSVSNLLQVFRKSGIESTSSISVCAYLFQQNTLSILNTSMILHC